MERGTAAAGCNRSFFVNTNGALLACGSEEKEEIAVLGLRGGSNQTPFTVVVPTPVPSMAKVRIHAVVCHENCNFALSEAGQVFAWGIKPSDDNIPWRKWHAPVPTVMEELRNHRVRQVAASCSHCAALTEDGVLFTWQTRRRFRDAPDEPIPELGHERFVHGFGVPRRVFAFEGIRIISVAVGAGFMVAMTEAGAVYSFGVGDGRLGLGEEDGDGFEMEDVFLPKRIEALDGIHVAAVATGKLHALALTRCGRVYSWGAKGRDIPVHGLGSGSDCGGGGDDSDDIDYHVPQLITALLGVRVRAIAAGPWISPAVTDEGALYTWGNNGCRNLGHGDARDRDQPKLVQGVQGICVVGVSIAFKHTLALDTDAASMRSEMSLGWASAGRTRVINLLRRRSFHRGSQI
jgi:alpha-tubulin suppressor-like RCC1 family protein